MCVCDEIVLDFIEFVLIIVAIFFVLVDLSLYIEELIAALTSSLSAVTLGMEVSNRGTLRQKITCGSLASQIDIPSSATHCDFFLLVVLFLFVIIIIVCACSNIFSFALGIFIIFLLLFGGRRSLV